MSPVFFTLIGLSIGSLVASMAALAWDIANDSAYARRVVHAGLNAACFLQLAACMLWLADLIS